MIIYSMNQGRLNFVIIWLQILTNKYRPFGDQWSITYRYFKVQKSRNNYLRHGTESIFRAKIVQMAILCDMNIDRMRYFG